MKLLTLQINGSFECIFDFDKTEERTPSYVVQSSGGNADLFSVPSLREGRDQLYSVLIQSDSAPEDAYLFRFEEKTLPAVPGLFRSKQLDFYLNLPNEGRDIDDVLEAERDLDKMVVDDNLTFYEKNLIGNNAYGFTVNFHLVLVSPDGVKDVRTRSFRLFFSPSERIWNVSLDFGSEASQMLIYPLSMDHPGPNECKQGLFSYFKDLYPALSLKPDKNFLQYDDSDDGDSLFRSLYFAPKQLTSVTLDSTAKPGPATNPNMDFLTEFVDTRLLPTGDLMSIPNVKFAVMGADIKHILDSSGRKNNVLTFKNQYFYRCAINSFLYRAMDKILEDSVDDNCAFVRLYVLMPNVYDHNEVAKNLRYIDQDVETIRKTHFNDHIMAVEVNVVSESDASLLGCMYALSNNSPFVSGRYLIMDAGKGTLDFSVVNYDEYPDIENGEFPCTCVYRSGIIGAGNALSYALFLDILTAMISPYITGKDPKTEIQRIIKTQIENGDESLLASLMNAVDDYKRLLPEDDSSVAIHHFSAKPGVTLTSFNLDSIVDSMNDLFVDSARTGAYRLDKHPYLDAMIRKLVHDAVEELNYQGPLDYVLFMGRGFCFNRFKTAMLDGLKSKSKPSSGSASSELCWEGLEELELNLDEVYNMKNVCLFSSIWISLGKYEGRRVGIPFIVNGSQQDGGQNGNVGNKSSFRRTVRGLMEKLRKGGRFSGSEGGRFNDIGKMKENDFMNGIDLEVEGQGCRVCLNGYHYFLPRTVIGTITVFFDGERFVYRHGSGTSPFTTARGRTILNRYESTFPYADVPASGVPFPC